MKYNQCIKWVLFCVVYVLAVCLALGLLIIITGDFKYKLDQAVMLSIELQNMAMIVVHPLIASGVYTAATGSYRALRGLQAANVKSFDPILNHKVTKQFVN